MVGRLALLAVLLLTPACRPGVRPEFRPGTAPVAPFVAAELAAGRAEDVAVLVYVGAPWCEPCTRFHLAVEAGELDGTLPPLRLLEFDADRDREALHAAGYTWEMLPLFARPEADGRGPGRRIEGSIKGPAAVDQNLLPRLRDLLQRPAS